MAQRYLPEIVDGDKRILLIAGKPVDYCLARIPQGDEFRGNLAASGRGEGRTTRERDRWIDVQVGPRMRGGGSRFAGPGRRGEYISEVTNNKPERNKHREN